MLQKYFDKISFKSLASSPEKGDVFASEKLFLILGRAPEMYTILLEEGDCYQDKCCTDACHSDSCQLILICESNPCAEFQTCSTLPLLLVSDKFMYFCTSKLVEFATRKKISRTPVIMRVVTWS